MTTPVYEIKQLPFRGRDTRICLQSQNGPCPLLAVVNALLLRGTISLNPDSSLVTTEILVQTLVDHILQRKEARGVDDPNWDATWNDILSYVIPQIAEGLDINLKFSGPQDFEYDPQISFFDILNVKLLHGWVLDKQDTRTWEILEGLSFNQAMDKMVHLQEQLKALHRDVKLEEKTTEPELKDEEAKVQVRNESKEEYERKPIEEKTEARRSEEESHNLTNQQQDTIGEHKGDEDHLNQQEDTTRHQEEKFAHDEQEHPLATKKQAEVVTSVDEVFREQKLESPNMQTNESENEESIDELKTNEEASKIALDIHTLQQFFDSSASQLTYFGLMQLYEHVEEGELSVLFRNNHFSTIVKHEGKLYQLVTDHGYAEVSNVGWELLDEINGDTVMVSPVFGHPAQYTPAGQEDPCSGDEMLARQLQEAANAEAAQERARRPPATEAQTTRAAPPRAPPRVNNESDSGCYIM